MLTNQEQFIIILTSAISGGLCTVAGIIFFVMMTRYAKMIRKINNIILPTKLKLYGVMVSGISVSLGLFLLYRVFFVVNEQVDFPAQDWLLFDILVGIVLFAAALWSMEDFKIRLKLMLGS